MQDVGHYATMSEARTYFIKRPERVESSCATSESPHIIDDKKFGTFNLIACKTTHVTISQQFHNWEIIETGRGYI